MTGWRITMAIVVAGSLAGCATLEDRRGYIPDQVLLDEIMVGLDTKTTVRRIAGPPGATGLIEDGGWYYVSSDYRTFAWRAPVEVDREVVAITFDEQARVENIERFGLEDGQVVVLSRRVTTSNTRGIGFLRQLFSNLGNLAPDQFLEQ
jgi:outer membrane protein assembly factor BamE (lipoprotein component of BamABCDE complex)